MQLFYAPDILIDFKLPMEEAKHCIKILRHAVGDAINVTDGKGFFYKCELLNNIGSLKILDTTSETNNRNYHLHLAVAPTKNGERTDWMIEKLVEFGVDEITFLNCSHNERNKINIERCERVAIAAMKQSLKSTLVKINDMMPISSLLKNSNQPLKLMAHCNSSIARQNINQINSFQNILCCIGPEGDFTKEEIHLALEHGFNGISLGESRLRTETAAIAVCSYFYFR